MKLSVDRKGQLVERLAVRLHGWGLGTPAIALLETHKPLSFIASQTLLVFQPFLYLFFDGASLEDYVLLLEDSSNLELIVRRLEQLERGSSLSE